MRRLITLGLGLTLVLAEAGCSKEDAPPPTQPLVGNRGAIGPGGVRKLPGATEGQQQPPGQQPGAGK